MFIVHSYQIVDDVLNLARADYVNYTLALGVVQYLENETNYIPWLSALNNLNFVSLRLSGENLTLYEVSDSNECIVTRTNTLNTIIVMLYDKRTG